MIPKARSVRVAILLPLSGPSAGIGQALLNSAQMAVFDVANEQFSLLPFDTQGTPEGARQAAADALAQGAELVLGPLFAADVAAISPQLQQAQVPIVTFSTDPSVAAPGVYVIGFLLREQARRVVDAALTHGLNRFALLAPDSPFGRLMGTAYLEAVTAQMTSKPGTAQLVARELYSPTDPANLSQAVQRLAAARESSQTPFNVLMVPDSGAKLKDVVALLNYYGLNGARVKLVGPMLWDDPQITQDPTMAGAWYPAPPPASHQGFASRYQSVYGGTPPTIASLGYDAAALAAVLARQPLPPGGDGKIYTNQSLSNPNGFAGIDGVFRFLTNGLSERGLAVMEIQPGGPRQIGEASGTFVPAVN